MGAFNSKVLAVAAIGVVGVNAAGVDVQRPLVQGHEQGANFLQRGKQVDVRPIAVANPQQPKPLNDVLKSLVGDSTFADVMAAQQQIVDDRVVSLKEAEKKDGRDISDADARERVQKDMQKEAMDTFQKMLGQGMFGQGEAAEQITSAIEEAVEVVQGHPEVDVTKPEGQAVLQAELLAKHNGTDADDELNVLLEQQNHAKTFMENPSVKKALEKFHSIQSSMLDEQKTLLFNKEREQFAVATPQDEAASAVAPFEDMMLMIQKHQSEIENAQQQVLEAVSNLGGSKEDAAQVMQMDTMSQVQKMLGEVRSFDRSSLRKAEGEVAKKVRDEMTASH